MSYILYFIKLTINLIFSDIEIYTIMKNISIILDMIANEIDYQHIYYMKYYGEIIHIMKGSTL